MKNATNNAADLATLNAKGSRPALRKVGNPQDVVVLFSFKGEDAMRLYTYSTHTDYTTDFTMTREAARAEWRRLRADGFVPEKW